MLVVDASVAAKFVLGEPGFERADDVLTIEAVLTAPSFFYVEVAQVLWTAVRRKRLTHDESRKAFGFIRSLRIETTNDTLLLDAARDLSERLDIAVYDALYVALAVQSAAKLVTSDDALCAKLRRARIGGMSYELI